MQSLDGAAMANAPPTPHNLRVFISYSRRDAMVAEALVATFETSGIQVIIDRRDLPYGEEWQKELADFIRASDTIVWLISPDSIASKWCHWELGEVARLNKRLIPVRIRDVANTALPPALGRIHILPVEGTFVLADHGAALVEALETDRIWLKEATRLSDRARQWIDAGRARALLLRGEAITAAERWKDRQPNAAPSPSADVLDLVLSSRRAATRRIRFWLAGAATMALVGFGLAGVATWQRNVAVRNEAQALANERLANDRRLENLRSESRLVAVAAHQLIDENRPGLAQAIALEGLPREPGERPLVEDALKALKRAIRSDRSVAELALPGERFRAAAFTPDGKRLVATTDKGLLTSWDVATLRPGPNITTGNGELSQFDISPDGRRVIAASDKRPGIWNIETGERVLELPVGPRGFVFSGRFSPDGGLIALGHPDNRAELRDAATGALLHEFKGPANFAEGFRRRLKTQMSEVFGDDPINRFNEESTWRNFGGMHEVLFSPDSKWLVVAGHGDAEAAARVYDTATGQLISTLLGDNLVATVSLQRIAFSPDGRHLAIASRDSVIRIWSTVSWRVTATLAHTTVAFAIAFGQSSTLLFAGYGDGSVRIWSTEDGQPVAVVTAHTDRVSALAFSRDANVFATSSHDRSVGLWWHNLKDETCNKNERNLFCDAAVRSAGALRGHADRVDGVVLSLDGTTVASVAQDATLRLWRSRTAGLHELVAPSKPPQADPTADCDKPLTNKVERDRNLEERLETVIKMTEKDARCYKQLSDKDLRKLAADYGLHEESRTLDAEELRRKLNEQIEGVKNENVAALKDYKAFKEKMSSVANSHRRQAHVKAREALQIYGIHSVRDRESRVRSLVFSTDGRRLFAKQTASKFQYWDVEQRTMACQIEGQFLSGPQGGGVTHRHPLPRDLLPAECPKPLAKDELPVVYIGVPGDDEWQVSPAGTSMVLLRRIFDPPKVERKPEEDYPAYVTRKTEASRKDDRSDRNHRVLVDATGKRLLAELAVDGRQALAIRYSADGRRLLVELGQTHGHGIGQQFGLWDAASGVRLGVTELAKRSWNLVDLSGDGSSFILARRGEPGVSVYSAGTGDRLTVTRVAAYDRTVSAAAIAADADTIAVGTADGVITLYDRRGVRRATLPGGSNLALQIQFSPATTVLAVADTANTLTLWDLANALPMLTASLPARPEAFRFSPMGDRLAFRTEDNRLYLLEVELDGAITLPNDLIDWARASLAASLTESDRQRFLLRNSARATPVAPSHRTAAGSASDADARRADAVRRIREQGLPALREVLVTAAGEAGEGYADAVIRLAINLDRDGATPTEREAAYVCYLLGHSIAEVGVDAPVNRDLAARAAARLKILPRQLEPATLVRLFREARSLDFAELARPVSPAATPGR